MVSATPNMNKILISLSLSLFAACGAYADDEELAKGSLSSNEIDENMRQKAEFSCLKYAAMRLGNEMSLRITQVKQAEPDSEKNLWIVAGNKINSDDPERPIGFACKLLPNDGYLWDLDDLSLFQVTEESVAELKKAGKASMKKQAEEQGVSGAAAKDAPIIPFALPEDK